MSKVYLMIFGMLAKVKQKIRMLYIKLSGYHNVSYYAIIERNVTLDRVYKEGVIIEDGALVAQGAVILTHEHVKRSVEDPFFPYRAQTTIGKNAFIGINAIICPGVSIGFGSVVAAGAIVTRDVEPETLVGGNPAKRIKEIRNLGVGGVYNVTNV